MAEEKKVVEKGPGDDKPKGGGGHKLMMLVLLLMVVLLVAVGAVGYLLLSGNSGSATAGDKAKAHASESKKHDAPPIFAKLDTFVVNLAGGNALLQVDMQAELADEAAQKKLTDYMPKIRSAVILLLSAKTSQELASSAGKLKLKNQVKMVINGAMESDSDEPIKSIVFTSFIIQNS